MPVPSPDKKDRGENLTQMLMANQYSVKSHTYTGWGAHTGKPTGYRRQYERSARRYWNKATKELADDFLVNGDSAVVLTHFSAPRIH